MNQLSDKNFSDLVQDIISISVENYSQDQKGEDPLLELISMGELVDRLSIVNFKLYDLKNKVMATEDASFRSWASVEDVKLVMERSRLKKAIDMKLIFMINKIIDGNKLSGFNPEVKDYGNENRS